MKWCLFNFDNVFFLCIELMTTLNIRTVKMNSIQAYVFFAAFGLYLFLLHRLIIARFFSKNNYTYFLMMIHIYYGT